MNLYQFDTLGLTHFVSAILAMFFGMGVVLLKKGTKKHIWVGYSYAISMIVLNLTALLIYKLFGKFGPFHAAAVFSFLTLLGGLIPA